MKEKTWAGTLQTSFQMMGRISISLLLDGYPDVGESNKFFEDLKGKQVHVLVSEVEDLLQVKSETRDRLKSIGHKGESYDTIINRLLDTEARTPP